jgi:hypothetical protein
VEADEEAGRDLEEGVVAGSGVVPSKDKSRFGIILGRVPLGFCSDLCPSTVQYSSNCWSSGS